MDTDRMSLWTMASRPPGTGKTTTILAVAHRLYGVDYCKQTLEARPLPRLSWPPRPDPLAHDATHFQLKASDDRGVDIMREQIKSYGETARCSLVPTGSSGSTRRIRRR